MVFCNIRYSCYLLFIYLVNRHIETYIITGSCINISQNPGTEDLALSQQEKESVCQEIAGLMKKGYPIFNLKSAFPYLVEGKFPTPCYQCLVIEDGKEFICGRCVEIPELCDHCGYFFAAEYALLFRGYLPVIWEALRVYLRYI